MFILIILTLVSCGWRLFIPWIFFLSLIWPIVSTFIIEFECKIRKYRTGNSDVRESFNKD